MAETILWKHGTFVANYIFPVYPGSFTLCHTSLFKVIPSGNQQNLQCCQI